MISESRLIQAVLREDFCAFLEKVFETVASGDAFIPNWHIEAASYALDQCAAGKTRRLVITQPPRSLKSIAASVAFPAWVLGGNPARRLICVSYGHELAFDHARLFRLVVESDWYRALFPRMRLRKDTEAECITTGGGWRFATSIGGTLTGRGADIIIIDDPLKAEDAGSEPARRDVIAWYQGTLATRLNDKNTGVIIIVMQRLHEDDLAGHVLRSGGWRHLDLPAIAIEDQKIEIGPGRIHRRKEGDLLQPMREPAKVLQRLKAELGTTRFSAQYQQQPIPVEGNIVKGAWIRNYGTAPCGPGVQIVQSWDTATTVGESNDYSACVTAAVYRGRYYILDVWRGRLTYPDLKRKIISHARVHRSQVMLIEQAGPGIPLVQEFVGEHNDGVPRPIGVRPEGDKVMRLEAASPVMERGDLLVPVEAPWLGAFLYELLGFPGSRHDDQVDALSQLVTWHAAHLRRASNTGFAAPIIINGC